MYVSESAYRSLEIDKIKLQFASRARSELGVFMLSGQDPLIDIDQVLKRQILIEEYRKYVSIRGNLPWLSDISSVDELFEGAEETGMLSGDELLRIRMLLELASRIKDSIEDVGEDYPALRSLTRRVRDFSEELSRMSVIDEKGNLYDGASPKLREVREKIDDLRRKIRRDGNGIINGSSSHMLQERVLSLRNGRSVLLVRQEFVGRFPGILVDRSSSGNSAYMEPNSLVPLNNKMVELRQDEREEERRILRDLTAAVMSRRGAVLDAQGVVGSIDMLYAVSDQMDAERWILPEMIGSSRFRFFQVRHPLLGSSAVPVDVHCGGAFRILVVTGPNTGGKTVALKTVGVSIFLAWCGLPVPAVEGTQVGEISALFSDIGDEQSIEQSLSTFSAHLKNVIDILEESDENSLILLDELGAGTDPQEGAALGIALLKTLKRRGPLVLATTHHNPIKRFATMTDGVETASVDFDLENLMPTYRLIMGIPGQSNALAIAERLGMHREVLLEAKKVLQNGEASVESMIGELQKKNLHLDSIAVSMAKEKAEIDELRKAAEKERLDLERSKRRVIMRADKEAEKVLEQAENQARDMIRGLEDAAKSAASREMDRHRRGLKKSKERSRVRQASFEAKEIMEQRTKDIEVGDVVQITGSGSAGEVVSIQGKRVVVLVGGLKVETNMSKLIPSDKKIRPEVSGPSISVSRPTGVPSSIMVRGMTVDEAMPLVADYLDRAVLAGYGEVTVIHGRGEGILRRKVHELCRRLPYVSGFRLGENGEGGYGVTVISFRE